MPEAAIQPPPPSRRWLEILKIFAVGRNPRRTFQRAMVLSVTCYLIFTFVLLPVRVTGISMEPTYHDHSVNFSNRIAYLFHEPRRGDVVTIRYAGIHDMLMKRIIGLPGETVEFVHGRVLVNGALLAEPYLRNPTHWTLGPIKLDATEYFVVGDNREMRWQDHMFGKTNRERIVGKVLL
jgi:signal peptidase I